MEIDKGKVEELMIKNLLNQKELCEKAGISRQCFYLMMAHKRKSKPITLAKIANALNTTVEDITR